jgi:hypothetical protein
MKRRILGSRRSIAHLLFARGGARLPSAPRSRFMKLHHAAGGLAHVEPPILVSRVISGAAMQPTKASQPRRGRPQVGRIARMCSSRNSRVATTMSRLGDVRRGARERGGVLGPFRGGVHRELEPGIARLQPLRSARAAGPARWASRVTIVTRIGRVAAPQRA